MTELRKRMIECLQLRGLSARTQESYVRAVRQLAEHYHKSPDLITEEELRQYFLYLKNVKHYSRSTATIAILGGCLHINFAYCRASILLAASMKLCRYSGLPKGPLTRTNSAGAVSPGRVNANRFIPTFVTGTSKSRPGPASIVVG